jgi:hypothetical protein
MPLGPEPCAPAVSQQQQQQSERNDERGDRGEVVHLLTWLRRYTHPGNCHLHIEMGSCIRVVYSAAAVAALENPAGHKAAASAASPLGAESSPTGAGRTVCRHFETTQTWFLTSLTLQDLHGTGDRFSRWECTRAPGSGTRTTSTACTGLCLWTPCMCM